MKKVTLSALAAIAVAGTAFAGPSVVMSKDFKQPCVTPCFRDQEFQLDIFYSYNDAEHQGTSSATDTFLLGPATTPLPTGTLVNPRTNPLLTDLVPPGVSGIPTGSTVFRAQRANVSIPAYFHDGSGGGVGANFFFAKYFGIGVEGNWWDGIRTGFNGTLATRDYVIPPTGSAIDLAALATAAAQTNTSIRVNADGSVVIRDLRNFGNTKKSVANQVTGNLILRYPFEGTICWAPYIFGGGGGVFDGESTGFGDVGVGVEFRVTPNWGFFTDWRWQFMSGSGEDSNFRSTSTFRALRNTFGLNNLRVLEAPDRNDVSMTRVGIRVVF